MRDSFAIMGWFYQRMRWSEWEIGFEECGFFTVVGVTSS